MRQTLVLSLCAVLSAGVTAGCSSSNNSGGTGSGGSGATTSSGGSGATGSGGSGGTTGSGGSGGTTGSGGSGGSGNAAGSGGSGGNPNTNPDSGPPAGNPDGKCSVPAEAQAVDTSKPDHVVGTGTPASCTSAAFVTAVAKGGIITFNCGPNPVKITLTATAKVVNDTGPEIVIDGGGKVTLSGGGKRRILYMNTCDQAQKWTSSHCQNQDSPHLTVQNLTFVDGNAAGDKSPDAEGAGGAIFVRGGRFKIVNSRFFNNKCDPTGPDVGGAAVRVLSQYNTLPVYVVNSTFGGKSGYGNTGSNGGGLSSIGVSFTVINSLFSDNNAIGNGANPAKSGTPGGGSGGGIYNDGNTYTLSLCGVKMTNNTANEGGGAIFYVSNDGSGSMIIKDSDLENNPSKGFETKGLPGIFYKSNNPAQVTNSTLK